MGRDNLANTFGMFNFWTTPGLFGIPFLSGVLADAFSYESAFVFTGALFFVSALFLTGSAVLHRRTSAAKCNK